MIYPTHLEAYSLIGSGVICDPSELKYKFINSRASEHELFFQSIDVLQIINIVLYYYSYYYYSHPLAMVTAPIETVDTVIEILIITPYDFSQVCVSTIETVTSAQNEKMGVDEWWHEYSPTN